MPVYVFDGIAPSIKSDTRDKRRESREKAGKAWLELLARALQGEKCFTDEEIENATTSRMNMKKPTAVDQAFILVWMKEEDIECVGSLEEADMQCVKLEKDGIVDGIITEDSDMFALGAENLYCKLDRRKKGEYKVQHLNRDYFFHPSNPYKSQLNRHQHNLLDAALLLGNDYVSRIRGNGVGAVVQRSLEEKLPALPENASQSEKAERKRLLETQPRLRDSMLDKLALAENQKEWLLKYGTNGKSAREMIC